MTRLWHTPVLVLILSLAGGCTLTSATDEKVQKFVVKPGVSVHVDTRNGYIKIVEGPPEVVRVKSITKVRATSNPKELLTQVKVVVSLKSGVLYVTAEHPSGSFIKQYGVSFELTVPKATPLNLETRNGSIRLERMHGAVTAKTRNGSIKADLVAGKVQATTHNGSIRIENLLGPFELRTRNGSIQIRLADELKLTGKCVATTRNGSVRINAPKSLAADLSAEVRNGAVHSDFDLATSSRKHAAGKIGVGGPRMELKTRNGSIYLKSR
jgi:Toastrack DUF4097